MGQDDIDNIIGLSFEETMSMLQCGFVKCKNDGLLVYCNDYFCNMLGYTHDDLREKFTNITEILTLEDLAKAKKFAKKIKNEKSNSTYDIHFNGKDGKVICAEAKLTFAKEGDESYFYITFTDITTFNAEQKQLIDANDKLEATIEHAALYFWEYDIKNHISYTTEKSRLEFGLKPVETDYPECIIRRGIFEEKSEDKYRELHKLLETGIQNAEEEVRFSAKYGGGWYSIKYTVVFDKYGNPDKAYATAENIDKYKELEQRFNVACENEGIDTWIYYVNEKKATSFNKNGNQSSPIEKGWDKVYDGSITADYVHPDDVEKFRQLYRKIDKGEQFVTDRIRIKINKNRSWDWYRLTYTSVYDKFGRPYKAIGCAKNINKEVEDENRYSTFENYQTLANKSSIATFRLNLTTNWCGDIDTTNPVFLKMRGQSTVDGLFDEIYKHFQTKEEMERVKAVFSREQLIELYSQGETSPTIECRFMLMPGRPHWLKAGIYMTENPNTHDIEGVLYATDIDGKKQGDAIIKRLINVDYLYIGAIDIKTHSIKTYGIEERVVPYPPRVDGTSKYEDVMQKNCKVLIPADKLNDAMRKIGIDVVIEEVDRHDTYVVLLPMIHNGEVHYIQMKYGYLSSIHATIMFTMVDFSATYQKEKEHRIKLEKALDEARQASIAKSEFLSRMSHDMRTPMNGLLGLIELSSEMDMPTEVRESINKMKAAGNYLLSLINDTLDMNKIESNKIVLNLEPVNGTDFWESLMSTIKPNAEEKGVELVFSQPKGFSAGVYFLADKVRLQQILMNIVSNSIKFTDKGGMVKIQLDTTLENGTYKNVCVISDNGCGMSKKFLPKVFTTFEQENNNVNAMTTGTGLGMSIVKHLVELMNGTIEVQSEQDEGTTVTVKIDLTACDAPAKRAGRANSTDYGILSGKRVLMCEDHPLNTEIAVKLLEREGVIVETAVDGKQGVEKFEASKLNYYDAVLMDIRMPVMDGLTATSEIRKLNRDDAKTVPIIAMTANAFDEDIKKSDDAGMNAHLAKPIMPATLYGTLATFIEKRKKGNK